MATLIPNSAPTLTPVSAVDTSSGSDGQIVFLLEMDQSVFAGGNLVQGEYLVTKNQNLDTSKNMVENDFITLERIQLLPVPGSTLYYAHVNVPIAASNLLTTNQIRFRGYIGSTTTRKISVTNWSNPTPFKPPPVQPPTPTVFLIRNDDQFYYNGADQLFVQIPTSSLAVNYDLSEIKFIVSYNYRDLNNDVKWVVSEPLNGTANATVLGGSVLVDPINLPLDVTWSNLPTVAVNAILEYEVSGSKYYTVSEISTTVVSKYVVPNDLTPTIDDIVYNVYNDPHANDQKMTVNWSPGVVTAIPNYLANNFEVVVNYTSSMGHSKEVSSGDIDINTTSYEFNVPDGLYAAGSTSSAISFVVNSISETGGVYPSAPAYKNTFTFSTAPRDLEVTWATDGANDGNVDMLINFKNPANVGQGRSEVATIQVLNSDKHVVNTIEYSDLVTSSPDFVYVITLDEITTTSTGYVQVFMTTTDTNSDDRLQGPLSNLAHYTSTDTPIVVDITRDGGSLTSNVVSRTPLVQKNKLSTFGLHTASSSSAYFIVDVTTETSPKVYTDSQSGKYTVTLHVDSAGVYNYNFDFSPQWLSNASVDISKYVLMKVANVTGVASDHLFPVVP